MSFGIVLLTKDIFGGAEQRFTRLFFYLDEKYKGNFFYFVNGSLKQRIIELFPDADHNRIIALTDFSDHTTVAVDSSISTDRSSSFSLKKYLKRTIVYDLYYYLNSMSDQYRLYIKLNKYHKQLNIESYIGVFSGILPLYFFLSKNNRPGILFCNMDSWFSNILANPKREWYKKFVTFNYMLEKADLVDFLSPFVYDGVQKLGVKVPPEKVRITPASFIDYSKCRIGHKDKFRIAFSGRLEQDKNPLLFMNAALILAKEFPEVEFHIMGEGRLFQTINIMAQESGISNILVHGFHPNPPEVLAGTSVFVSIQTTNNYPSQSVLEAMACGNAIIATDVGDTRMFVSEETGSLIEFSLDCLLACLKTYISQPQLAWDKGVKASKYVRENHTIEKSADYYIELFNSIVKNNRV